MKQIEKGKISDLYRKIRSLEHEKTKIDNEIIGIEKEIIALEAQLYNNGLLKYTTLQILYNDECDRMYGSMESEE